MGERYDCGSEGVCIIRHDIELMIFDHFTDYIIMQVLQSYNHCVA